ncbi:MAG TPA: hypothetical protein VJI71_00650 [Candidatus Norongarragalinales archaeon]|nr:hypothetical protein [Candidatus Norongarragalinales archaeon]
MKALFLFFSFILISPFSFALGEYGFLLEPKELSFSYYALYPKSCAGFLNADTTLAENLRSDFAFSHARQSQTLLKKAKSFAYLQPRFVSLATLAAYRQYSIYCFSYGMKALKEASLATQEGLGIIDGNAAKLERMIGPDFQGFAGGVIEELGEAKRDIEKRNSKGTSLGSEVVKASFAVNSTLDSFSIALAIKTLVSKQSLLEKEITADDKVLKGIFLLEQEYENSVRDFEIAQTRFAFLKNKLEGEELEGIGENAFFLAGGGSGVAAEYEIESFEEQFSSARENERIASELKQQSASEWNGKGEAYASESISKMRESVQALETASLQLEEIVKKSAFLEKALKERVLAEKTKVEQLLITAGALEASRARMLLQQSFEPRSLKTSGERINFYLIKIVELQNLQGVLKQTISASSLKTRLESQISKLKDFLDKAANDANVDLEERKLQEIEQAAPFASAADLVYFQTQTTELKDNALALLMEEYGTMDEMFYKALSVKEFLSVSDQTRLVELKGFFSAGEGIDVENLAGELKKTGAFLNGVLAEVEVRTPEILRKHLQESAVESRKFDIPVLGEKTVVHHEIVLKNLLPLSYDKRIELDITIPAGSVVTEKSADVETAGKVYLDKAEEDSEYFVKYDTLEEIASEKKTESKTVYADFENALVEEKVYFDSGEDTDVVIIRRYQFPVDYAESLGGEQAEFYSSANSSEIRVLAYARKGSNAITLRYSYPNPVILSREGRAFENSFEILYALESAHADIQEFNGEIAEEGCDGKVKTITGEGVKKALLQEGVLLVEFYAKTLKQREEMKAGVLLDCTPATLLPQLDLESAIEGKKWNEGEVNRLWDEEKKLEKECEDCVFELKKQLLLGNWEKAEIEVENARQKVLEAGQKAEDEKNSFETLSQELSVLKEEASSAVRGFDVAFTPTQENSWELSRNVLYQQGKTAKTQLEKLLTAAGKAKTSIALNDSLESASLKLEDLKNIILQQREKTAQEITRAEEKQEQFGTQDSERTLAQAKDYSQKGFDFTAWVMARELNQNILEGSKKETQNNWTNIGMGVLGATVLIALAFLFLRKKPEGLKEAE